MDYSKPILSTFATLTLFLFHLSTGTTAQQVYAPFSGAIYIIGNNGEQITGASPAQCPSYAESSCSSIGYSDWCCPSGHTCQYFSTTQVCGCCPAGSDCSGTVSAAQVTTVTVTVTAYQTVAQQTTEYPAYVQPATTTEGYYNGYCSTLIANGPGLPTTREGSCGTILVEVD
ncbi:hypothetical protein K490DRAFT_54982 [Saccharata proteae CBS 121410]|uniref:Uncharacterized protein n=1 Tax=Saccharata proteae CBS 121410 TaxID=1314787 RepID=A0A6A5YCG8_9PEZI|nr:hypothetical protein K490DRAFT_54982 [Saccharata proteae CBS 121410]